MYCCCPMPAEALLLPSGCRNVLHSVCLTVMHALQQEERYTLVLFTIPTCSARRAAARAQQQKAKAISQFPWPYMKP